MSVAARICFGRSAVKARLHSVCHCQVRKTDGRREAGFIAEDVEKLDPRFATYDRDGKLEGVDYGHMIALLTKALQEQQAEIESLKAQVAALTKQNAQ